MGTTILMVPGPPKEVDDPGAVPYPEGPLWDRLGHELVYGREPAEVAEEYGVDPAEVSRLGEMFWESYSRAVWLAEAFEYSLLEELVGLPNRSLFERLQDERRNRAE